MNLVADTSVWSLVLRRRHFDPDDRWVQAFRSHVEAGNAVLLVGIILQELLSGVRTPRQFDRLAERLAPFPVIPLQRSTYVLAATVSNQCRRRGVQAGTIDALIAAACIENGFPLLTADADFAYIARHSELIVLPPCRSVEASE